MRDDQIKSIEKIHHPSLNSLLENSPSNPGSPPRENFLTKNCADEGTYTRLIKQDKFKNYLEQNGHRYFAEPHKSYKKKDFLNETSNSSTRLKGIFIINQDPTPDPKPIDRKFSFEQLFPSPPNPNYSIYKKSKRLPNFSHTVTNNNP